MTAAALAHRLPREERDFGAAFFLALAIHAALVAGLVLAVHWKSEPPAAVYAELWAPAAAPAAAPAPEPAPPPPPPPKAAAPEPEPEKPADIVVKTEPPKKKPEPKPEPRKPEPKKPEPKPEPRKPEPKKPEPRPDPRAAEREAKAAEARHQAELARVMGQSGNAPAAGSPNAQPGATGLSGSAAATYAGQVIGCVRPHIVFAVPDGARRGQFVADFLVKLLPTGEQVGAPKLVKSSGLAAYDAAVERAIRRCDPFPSPKGSAPPRELPLRFDPVDPS